MADYTPQPIEFADTAPFWVEGSAVAEATPEQVWLVLIDYPSWPSWFGGGVTSVRSTSDPSTGVGSTREVILGPGRRVRFDERFIAWEEGERWAFTGVTGPGVVSSLVERCVIEATSPMHTRVTYRMAFEPKPAIKPLLPLARPAVRRALTRAMTGLAKEAQARPHRSM